MNHNFLSPNRTVWDRRQTIFCNQTFLWTVNAVEAHLHLLLVKQNSIKYTEVVQNAWICFDFTPTFFCLFIQIRIQQLFLITLISEVRNPVEWQHSRHQHTMGVVASCGSPSDPWFDDISSDRFQRLTSHLYRETSLGSVCHQDMRCRWIRKMDQNPYELAFHHL